MAAPLPSREVAIDPLHAALLIIDVQNDSANRDAPRFRAMDPAVFEAQYGFLFRALESHAIENLQRLIGACRAAGIEVMFTVVESLTRDGRDRSLDHKICDMHVPKGSWGGKVLDAIAPAEDEIVLPKTSSSVFISTSIDYVLRNLGVRSLIVAGLLTDQCVDSAVRDACDLGYLVTIATDACATQSQERHDWSLRNNAGYARQRTTDALVAEIAEVAKQVTE